MRRVTPSSRPCRSQYVDLPLIAEDLGVITPEVEALRDRFGLPGMRVLQFGFSTSPGEEKYLPHRFVPHCVVYTGTHDNDTALGWLNSKHVQPRSPLQRFKPSGPMLCAIWGVPANSSTGT